MADDPLFELPADDTDEREETDDPKFERAEFQQPSTEETVRRSGLAWSAGIVFFSAIVFMLFLGWIADQLLGSSPWGLVGGIVLGSIVGFVQFFRISKQIYNPDSSEHKMHPLLSRSDDDEDDPNA